MLRGVTQLESGVQKGQKAASRQPPEDEAAKLEAIAMSAARDGQDSRPRWEMKEEVRRL